MSAVEIHVDTIAGALLVGRVVDGILTDLQADRLDHPSRIGAVVPATVERRPSVRSDGPIWGRLPDGAPVLLKFLPQGAGSSGAPVPVQITADPRPGKEMEATGDVAVPGRFLVYRPWGSSIHSRALTTSERRQWRAALPAAGGWIIRTAAADAPPEAVQQEAAALVSIGEQLSADAKLPPPGPVRRLWLDTPAAARLRITPAARAVLTRDALGDLPSPSEGALDLGERVPSLLTPSTPLPGGAKLTIDTVEAGTLIDVDAHQAARPDAANADAAGAIATALRLRNLAGLIVVDFIGTPSRDAGHRLSTLLTDGLAGDPANVQFGGPISSLGVLHLARQRRGIPLAAAFPDGPP